MLSYINNIFTTASPTSAATTTTTQAAHTPLSHLTPHQQNAAIEASLVSDYLDDNDYVFVNAHDDKFIEVDRLHALSEHDEMDSPTITSKRTRKMKKHTKHNNNAKSAMLPPIDLTASVNDTTVLTALYSKINEIEQQMQVEQLSKQAGAVKFVNKLGKKRVTDEILFGYY